MNIVVYGTDKDKLMHMIQTCGVMQYRQIDFFHTESYDEFLHGLNVTSPELIFVSVPGAKGMEAAIAAREAHPKAGLIWFADDEAFGAQSYRLDCTYFTSRPVDHTVMSDAIFRYCQAERVC